MKVRVIVVDDEPAARQGMAALVKNASDAELVEQCRNGVEAIQSIDKLKPDIVFLDVQMPEISGFEVLRSIQYNVPVVIFATAFDRYAVKAFEYHALDYLLKPFSDERFYQSLQKARNAIHQKNIVEMSTRLQAFLGDPQLNESDRVVQVKNETAGLVEKLIVKVSGKVLFIDYSDLHVIEADDYCVRIHYGTKVAVTRESMRNFENSLPPNFCRVHKSYIVNLKRIEEVSVGPSGTLKLKLNNQLVVPVSKSFRERFESLFGL